VSPIATIARVFYRLERVGPPLPGGPVLLVANHPNALLDPAVVSATAGRDVRFLAKSTLFSGSIVSPLVRGIGSIPVYRRTDEGADPSRNVEAFAAVGQALAAGEVVCIFPEGVSHSEPRLQPLKTGAARIVLAAADAGVRVLVVPIGLDYERKATFRARAVAVYGESFGASGEGETAGALTERIAERMRALVALADPRSDAEVVERIERLYAAAKGLPDDPEGRTARRRLVSEGLTRLRSEDPEWYASLRETIRAYDERLARFGLGDRDLDRPLDLLGALRFTAREGAFALVLVPLLVIGILLLWVPYRATGIAARLRRPSLDVVSTVKALAGLVFYVVWTLAIAGVAGWRWGPVAGVGIAAGLPLLAFTTLWAIERESAVLETARAWLAARRAPHPERARLTRERTALGEILDRVREWLER